VRRCELTDEPVLLSIRILILVHHDVGITRTVSLCSLRRLVEDLDRLDKQVVKIKGIRFFQPLVVIPKYRSSEFPGRFPGFFCQFVGRLSMILGTADSGLNSAGADNLFIDLQILHGCLHDLHLIGIVINGEVPRIAELVNLPAEQSHTKGVKCRNQRIARTRALEKIPHAELHLVGGLVRERYREDGIRTDSDSFDQVHDAIRDDTGFSTPGSSQDEYGAFSGLYGFELLRVEKSAEIHSSFYRNTLCEVTRLIDVTTSAYGDVVGEQLERNDFKYRHKVLIR